MDFTANFSVSGQNTTINISLVDETDRVQQTVEKAAEFLFKRGYGDHGTDENPIAYEDLTNQDKLDLVVDHMFKTIREYAVKKHQDEAEDAARATADSDAITMFIGE